jgi:hypothetical protein
MSHIWHALLDDPKAAVTEHFDGAAAAQPGQAHIHIPACLGSCCRYLGCVRGLI